MNPERSSEEYAGPSKFGNASAKAFLLAQLAAIPSLMGARITTGIVAIGGLIVGSIWGWNQAEKAEKQFRVIKDDVVKLNAENQALKNDAKWAERLANRPPEDKMQIR